MRRRHSPIRTIIFRPRRRWICWLLLALLPCARAAAFEEPEFPDARVYVDQAATGAQTGASWADALHEVDDAAALAASLGLPEVWVARGTYRRPLTMQSEVAVYGGFGGGETDLAQRNPAANSTIIDVTQSAGGLPAPHAVQFINIYNSLLDGFTITGGRAQGTTDTLGGGILCLGLQDGGVQIIHCAIRGNAAADAGGGAAVANGAAEFTSCTFAANSALRGGAIYAAGDAWPTFNRCAFLQNQADTGGAAALFGMGTSLNDCTILSNTATRGGGVAGGAPGVTLRNCTIESNSAVSGGAILASGPLDLRGCTLAGNWAATGGAVFCDTAGSLAADGCAFHLNAAAHRGGGLFYQGLHNERAGWLTACTISGNGASEGGGLAAITSLTLRGCILSANSALRGGALSGAAALLDLGGCTLADNAATSGGGVWLADPRAARLANCIFSNNADAAIRADARSTSDGLSLRHCLFSANATGDCVLAGASFATAAQVNALTSCSFNRDGDPAFIDLDFHIGIGSAALGAGLAAGLMETDRDALERPAAGGRFDIGACQGRPALSVDLGSLDFGPRDLADGPSPPLALLLRNTGPVELGFADPPFSLEGDNPQDFSILDFSNAPLEPGTTRTLALTFAPADLGPRTASLAIATADPAAPVRQVALRGAGTGDPAAIVAPLFTRDPAGLNLSRGQRAVFSAAATGGRSLSWRWQKDGVDLTESDRVRGTRTDTLTLDGVWPADEGTYACRAWNSAGAAVSAGAPLWLYRVPLHIEPDIGNPDPPAGDTMLTSGTFVTAAVLAPLLSQDDPATTRLVCVGAHGLGAAPSTSETLEMFVIDSPTTITWQWLRQHYLDVSVADPPHGSVSREDGGDLTAWCDELTSMTLTAAAEPGYRFTGWIGGLAGTANPIRFIMDRPIIAQARFVESIPPVGSITINRGAAATSSTAAMLTLSAHDEGSGVSRMRLGTDGSHWGAWENYATSRTWALSKGDGLKKVYVQYEDGAGNPSDAFSDSIVLDSAAPGFTKLAATPTPARQGSAVNLTFTVSESLASSPTLTVNKHAAALRSHSGRDYGFGYTIAAGDPDGTTTITITARDAAANTGKLVNASLLKVDSAAPQSAVTAPAGTIAARMLTVRWTASDIVKNNYASGLKSVDVYWKRNAGAYQKLGTYAAGTLTASFDTRPAGGPGRYYFYSVATDKANNTEPTPAQPDCTVLVNPVAAKSPWRGYE